MNLGHTIRNKGLEAPNLVLDILQGRHRVRPEKGSIYLQIELLQN